MLSKGNIDRHHNDAHDKKVSKTKFTPTNVKTIQKVIRDTIKGGYYVYCPTCNGTYTTEQYEKVHVHTKSHIENEGKEYTRQKELQGEARPFIKWNCTKDLRKELKKSEKVRSELKMFRRKMDKGKETKNSKDGSIEENENDEEYENENIASTLAQEEKEGKKSI